MLKVGHHASLDAVSDSTLEVLKPEYTLISVGEGNKFGHPKAETLELLERAGSRVLRTDRGGDLTVKVGTIRLLGQSGPGRGGETGGVGANGGAE